LHYGPTIWLWLRLGVRNGISTCLVTVVFEQLVERDAISKNVLSLFWHWLSYDTGSLDSHPR
jgi:hypothetical protein